MLQTLMNVLCAVLPRRLTGELRPIARRRVQTAFRDNGTQQLFSQGAFPGIIQWAGSHPVQFAFAIGVISGLLGTAAEWLARHTNTFLSTPFIKDFNVVDFFGPAWGVQATLVALVYPIVFSFIAVLIQRRASAKVMLRVYILDSGVLPAGLSSLTLTAVMTVEYFLLPYLGSAILTFLLSFNGIWLFVNIVMAGYFLTNTSRFIQDEAGNLALTRLAVSQVLREEVEDALVQELCAGIPERWGHDSYAAGTQIPKITMLGLSSSGDPVSLSIGGLQRLVDVRSGVLRFALRSVLTRPADEATKNSKKISRKFAASFFPPFGRAISGAVILGYVNGGLKLTRIERALIRSAFVFRKETGTLFQLATKDMLQELLLEAQALAEQRKFTAAREALLTAVRLHANLLSACENKSDLFDTAAQLHREPYKFLGSESFHGSWLELYRPLATIAVNVLDEDTSLFEAISYTHCKLAGLVKQQPFGLHADSMHVPSYLLYRLAMWWSRRVEVGGSETQSRSFLKLPEPTATIYRQALLSFIGGWSGFQIRITDSSEGKLRWWQVCNKAKAYCCHIEESARFLLDAVARKDEEAATRLGDHFIKWWGTKQFELEIDEIDENPNFSHIDYSLLEMTYSQACEVVRHQDGSPVSDVLLEQAANLALRRYWESLRLLLACALLATDLVGGVDGSLRVRIASHFILGKRFYPGNSVVCDSCSSTDTFLAAVIRACFTDKVKTRRLDRFFEKREWFKDTPMVSGWLYGGAMASADAESFKYEFVAILLALFKPNRQSVLGVWGLIASHSQLHKSFEKLYDDVDLLGRVANFGNELSQCLRESGATKLMSFALVLRRELGQGEIPRSARFNVWLMGKALRASAKWDQRITRQSRDVSMSHLASLTSQLIGLAFPENKEFSETYSFCAVLPGKSADVKPHAYSTDWFSIDELYEGAPREFDTNKLNYAAQNLRQVVVVNALLDVIDVNKPRPVTEVEDSRLIETVAQRISAAQAAGQNPIVLGTGRYVDVLSPRYDDEETNRVPAGVTLSRPGIGARTEGQAYVNETPVFEVAFPYDACYVLSRGLVDTATLQGEVLSRCFAVSYERKGLEKVLLRWSWASASGRPSA